MSQIDSTWTEPSDILWWRGWVRGQLRRYHATVLEELGPHTLIDVPESCRVIVALTEHPRTAWHVAYPSSYDTDARLILDDYVPELGEGGVLHERPQ